MLQPQQLLKIAADFFESARVNYCVVGSIASIAYGEPRFTNDIDLVADLALNHLPQLVATFPPPDFYLSESAARDAIVGRRQFNIIHLPSGMKIDVILPAASEHARMELTRARRLNGEDDFSAWFAAPEDVILGKLRYYQLGGSDKHLRDISAILKIQTSLDSEYLAHWVHRLGLTAEWIRLFPAPPERPKPSAEFDPNQ